MVAFWLTSILISRPLLGKCTGLLTSKVLEVRIDQYVTSLYHAVTISRGKVVRKRTWTSVGIQGGLYKSWQSTWCPDELFVFNSNILEKYGDCRIVQNVLKNVYIWRRRKHKFALCARRVLPWWFITAHLSDNTLKLTCTLRYFEQLWSCGQRNCLSYGSLQRAAFEYGGSCY